MANQLGIVHPQMLVRLQANFYPSACTIQSATEAADSFGQLQPTWGNLAGHVNLPCRVAPDEAFSRENRTEAQIYAVGKWKVSISGYYPAITEKMRMVSGGINYDIELVEFDGNQKTTHLRVSVTV